MLIIVHQYHCGFTRKQQRPGKQTGPALIQQTIWNNRFFTFIKLLAANFRVIISTLTKNNKQSPGQYHGELVYSRSHEPYLLEKHVCFTCP